MSRLLDEIAVMNDVLFGIDGQESRTCSVPCSQRPGPFIVPSWGPLDGPDGQRLAAYVARVTKARGLGVFQFHGIGGDYLAMSADAHRELPDYLRKHPEVRVATFREVMDHVAAHSRQTHAGDP